MCPSHPTASWGEDGDQIHSVEEIFWISETWLEIPPLAFGERPGRPFLICMCLLGAPASQEPLSGRRGSLDPREPGDLWKEQIRRAGL